jgi:type VI secretion system protein ImpM
MPTIGLYGKLPCRGDFVQRRVPQEFVDVWDTWMRESLAASRSQLAERWLDAYLTSPMWRFVLTGGLCGDDVYSGVLIPSVDRVGRYFPLTIVARWEAQTSALTTAYRQGKWFQAAETLALRALEAITLDFEEFDRCVADLAVEIDPTVDPAAEHGPGHRYLPLRSGQSLPEALSVMAIRDLECNMHPLSLWWTDGSAEISPGALCMTGLPEPRSYSAMLSGDLFARFARGNA